MTMRKNPEMDEAREGRGLVPVDEQLEGIAGGASATEPPEDPEGGDFVIELPEDGGPDSGK